MVVVNDVKMTDFGGSGQSCEIDEFGGCGEFGESDGLVVVVNEVEMIYLVIVI